MRYDLSQELQNPLVSIVIPVYNGANYVAEAIESALNQTYQNIEIIVVNDGSNDNGATERVIAQYKERIRYFKKENGGVSSALNLGIRNMKGTYFSWLSHDDKYEPNKIERQIALLVACDFSDNVVALCNSCHMDQNSVLYNSANRNPFQNEQHVYWKEALLELFRNGSFNGCALLIPKRVFDVCGTFHEGMRFSQDYLMWIEMFLHGTSLIYSDYVGVRNRIHGAQVTQTRKDLFYKDSNELCSIILDRVVSVSDSTCNLLYEYALHAAKYNNGKVAEQCIAVGMEHGLISMIQRIKIKSALVYGRIRPWIRKVHYKVFRRVEVQ